MYSALRPQRRATIRSGWKRHAGNISATMFAIQLLLLRRAFGECRHGHVVACGLRFQVQEFSHETDKPAPQVPVCGFKLRNYPCSHLVTAPKDRERSAELISHGGGGDLGISLRPATASGVRECIKEGSHTFRQHLVTRLVA